MDAGVLLPVGSHDRVGQLVRVGRIEFTLNGPPAQAQGRPDVAGRQGRLAQGQASLLHNYQRPETSIRGSIAPTDRFRSAVQDAKIGPGKDIPHVTPTVIVKYITCSCSDF